eukprot:COSAG02_NODE_16787_length_1055_cov_2.357741_2_plen_259_part_00
MQFNGRGLVWGFASLFRAWVWREGGFGNWGVRGRSGEFFDRRLSLENRQYGSECQLLGSEFYMNLNGDCWSDVTCSACLVFAMISILMKTARESIPRTLDEYSCSPARVDPCQFRGNELGVLAHASPPRSGEKSLGFFKKPRSRSERCREWSGLSSPPVNRPDDPMSSTKSRLPGRRGPLCDAVSCVLLVGIPTIMVCVCLCALCIRARHPGRFRILTHYNTLYSIQGSGYWTVRILDTAAESIRYAESGFLRIQEWY